MANDVRTRPRARTRRPPEHGAGNRGPTPGLLRRLTAGGTEGNERLTVLTGLLLVVLFAALGITILQLQALMWLHLFLGLLLLGPIALKLASTGYRFLRYYTRNRRYRIKGPPAPALRLLAPAVVGLTVLVFGSGVALLFVGPTSSLRPDAFLVHKASFILWLGATGLHVLGHLPEVFRFLRVSNDSRMEMIATRSARPRSGAGRAQPPLGDRLPGGSGRWLSLSTALVLGLVLAIALIPDFGSWTGALGLAVLHHHHG